MFEPPPDGTGTNLTESLFVASLPQVKCKPCGRLIARRKHRVQIRASWMAETEVLCPQCWSVICAWGAGFALQQLELPLA